MYKTFLLFTFLCGSFVCYHADQTMATDSGVAEVKDEYPEPPVDAKEVTEFVTEEKKCPCEQDKSNEKLNEQKEKAAENLAETYIQQKAAEQTTEATNTSFVQIDTQPKEKAD